ncbi:PhzF family phenazine biosynthesis isomerase [Azotosporobacter soli]|uniref:PhzF family phenazine biosynthesis protein n=1 Tax=Azotosporobacter soli TaxID=3055040 RepID=UPI0031FE91CE
MSECAFYQVDAFSLLPFKGNPAAVCLLEQELPDATLQAIAAEMNLSETAFVQRLPGMDDWLAAATYHLRWFTPLLEVPLCGHATLAAAKVLFDEWQHPADRLEFATLSGTLHAKREAEGIALDFPLDRPIMTQASPELLTALGLVKYEKAFYGERTGKLVLQLADSAAVYELQPDFLRLSRTPFCKGIAVTARDGDRYDFVSRYFNPWAGVNEDPVTGSVHTLLAAWWGEQLKKTLLRAYQASPRGGEMLLRHVSAQRLELIGDALVVARGKMQTGQ